MNNLFDLELRIAAFRTWLEEETNQAERAYLSAPEGDEDIDEMFGRRETYWEIKHKFDELFE